MNKISKYFDLNGQNIVVTGGNGHLGVAMVKILLEHNANVLIVTKSITSYKKAKHTFSEFSKVSYFQGDITKEIHMRKLIYELNKLEKINCIINNAYSGPAPEPLNASDNDFMASYGITVNASYKLITECKVLLKNAADLDGNASIINIASMYGSVSPKPEIYAKTGVPINPVNYGVAKAGLIQLTKYLSIILAEHNIRVNSISPGAMPFDTSNKKFLYNLEKNIPLGRVGKPEDLQGVIVFLASKMSSYITGSEIKVDGGWTAW